MNDYFTRLLTAVESIAESLETLAGVAVNLQAERPDADDATPPRRDPSKDVEAAEPPKRRRRTKAEMEAARAAEEAAKTEPPKAEPPKTEPVAAATEKAPAFDYAILKANVIKLATKFGDEGKKNAINLLASYNVTKADQADPEVWPEMNEKFEAAIATLEAPEDDEFA